MEYMPRTKLEEKIFYPTGKW